MRMFGAFGLSLAGAIVTFLAVLAVLDDEPMAVLGIGDRSRVAAFATPALATATTGSLATLRPVPAMIERGDESSRPVTTKTGTEVLDPARSARVPPISRRAPKDPTPVTPAEASSTVASSQAKPRKPAVRPELPGLDTATRSALGGPRPAIKVAPAPAVPRPLQKSLMGPVSASQ